MNICSNQIKEVILHRFKVNSLQKLLIHINFLLAFSVLFCSHSAFGQQSGPIIINEIKVDHRAVDLGLNVYWAKYNVGATDSIYPGDYFTWDAASNWSDADWQHWRTPNKSEMDDLCNSTKICRFFQDDGIQLQQKLNGACIGTGIFIPISGYKETPCCVLNETDGYLWTSTEDEDHFWSWRAYGMFLGLSRHDFEVRTAAKRTYQPIRPVIKKVTITLKTSDGNTTVTKSYPYGSKIQIGAFIDECHRVAYWTKSKSSNNSLLETITDIQGDNGYKEIFITEDVTYTAYFSIKTTNVKATTEDNQKGTVGLSIGNENN